jgi:hypothetical protein
MVPVALRLRVAGMGKCASVADHDQALASTAEHHVDALGLFEETDLAITVTTHQGNQDDVTLLTLHTAMTSPHSVPVMRIVACFITGARTWQTGVVFSLIMQSCQPLVTAEALFVALLQLLLAGMFRLHRLHR